MYSEPARAERSGLGRWLPQESAVLALACALLGTPTPAWASTHVYIDASGDLSGTTDHANVTAAFAQAAAAGPGSTVELGAGDFYFHKPLQAENCACDIRGAGKDATRLHTVENFGLGEGLVQYWPGFLVIYPAGDAWEPDEQFEVSVSDMTFLIEHGNTGWGSHNINAQYHSMNVVDTLGRTFDRSDPRYGDFLDPANDTNLRVTYRSLRAIGRSGAEFAPFGESILNVFNVQGAPVSVPVTINGITVLLFKGAHRNSGAFLFEDLEYSHFAWGIGAAFVSGADIRIGGKASTPITATNGRLAIQFADISRSNVEVSHVTASRMGGVVLEQGVLGVLGIDGAAYPELLPAVSTFDFHHNLIELAPASFISGFELWNYARLFGTGPNTILANISQNTIVFDDSINFDRIYPGIFSCGVDDALVNANTFKGRSTMAINPEFFSLNGLCGGSGWALVGNNFSGFSATWAPIVLWPGTNDYSVVGSNGKVNVADFGTNNVIAGVNNQGPTSAIMNLGRSVSSGMMLKR